MKKPYVPALIILAIVIIAVILWAVWMGSGASTAVAPVTVPAATTTVETATSTTPTASSTEPVYTLADIAQHSTASSCWLAIDGNVYDVTKFIPIHPGGKAILNGCGKDASTLFHSVAAHAEHNAEQTVAPQYQIGVLAQ